jgi:alkaline phosphatase
LESPWLAENAPLTGDVPYYIRWKKGAFVMEKNRTAGKFLTVILLVALAVFYLPHVVLAGTDNVAKAGNDAKKARNIIFMVPDGMGLADVTAARIYKNGYNGGRLCFESLDEIGYQSTQSANSTVTDSAAAASAWAAGEKFANGEISYHSKDKTYNKTILELAAMEGKATGLVVTSTITHATPAAFGAHVHSRKCETEIGRQYIFDTRVDVLLGGGIGVNRPPCSLAKTESADVDTLIKEAQGQGYQLVKNKAELKNAVAGGAGKVLGIFTSDYPTRAKTPEYFRVDPSKSYPEGEPTLAEMTRAALGILEKDKDGFFLLVEGSQVDWGNHANKIDYQISETLGFDQAVSVVLDWLKADKSRAAETLLIIVPDHECGGFAINGPYGSLSKAGDIVQPGWTSNNHTAVDTIIWSQGPGSLQLGKSIDNTDIYEIMKNTMN